MLIDTHAHLYLEEFDTDREEAVRRAEEAGISKIYLPNVDSRTIDAMISLESTFPGKCFAMMGLHPCSVKENYLEELALVESWLQRRPFSAIGEIGIDLHWDQTFIEEQKEAFRTQIRWAKEYSLPIVIHSRESLDMTIALVREEKETGLTGIFHCFSGTVEQAKEIKELGFYMGIGGVLTFKKAGLDEILKEVPLEYLVLETDSPYLAPVPFRGKRNESAYIKLIAEKLATVKNVPFSEVSDKTSTNAEKIFGKNPVPYTTLS